MWSEAEDSALRAAVGRFGHRWSVIVNSGVLPARSCQALRLRWLWMSPQPMALLPPSLGSVFNDTPTVLDWLPIPRVVRSRSCGRPWDYYVGGGGGGRVLSTRSPTERQSLLLSLWGLDVMGPKVLCNLSRAEVVVRRHLSREGVGEDDNSRVVKLA